ncbi:hypothetical protein AB1Y20_017525 [Prymnesium parvum]|uniref:Uncharacterized protein n=1 Tax=Prymnesium parvum TaxID=97485 RepID=A0AB34JNH6_PRYPA
MQDGTRSEADLPPLATPVDAGFLDSGGYSAVELEPLVHPSPATGGRQLDAAFKGIKAVASTGARRVYEATRTVKGEFIVESDRAATSVKRMKNSESRLKTTMQLLKSAEEKVVSLTDELAHVRAELCKLRTEENARLRREAVDARQREREQRHEQRLASALQKEEARIRKELEQRAEVAEARASEAKLIAADAQEEAVAQNWFTGERWLTFCAGERGSPGGPQAIAKIVKIIADDLEARGVNSGSAAVAEAADGEAEVAPRKSSGRAAFTQRALAKRAASDNQHLFEEPTEVRHVPTEIERSSNQAALQKIRDRHGSRSQTLFNALLAFDAYFAWWYPFKQSLPLRAPQEERDARALDNCRLAIDMHEVFERISINNHGSYLPHGAIYKVTRDIMRVGDVWAFGTSPLELQNADTKRVAADVGARNIKFLKVTENATTMSLSTFQHVLTTQHLRSGEGERKMIDSRRRERVFGTEGSGRLTAYK